ncbi:TRAP transporter substrate-binding protein [Ruminococcus sp. HUN007]|uniref:TRAP transporter substrate-binding protein n=1 Tax=Ruminococcus sp. HUN007 TaxID=1514668 RepID=UPI0006786AEA|nr:TRAP transporter substrate-binding protein [Ruminococcus sp. HUN007]
MGNRYRIVKRAFICFLAAGALSLCGCKGTEPGSADSIAVTEEETEKISFPIMIEVGYSTDRSDPRGVSLEDFKKNVERESNSNIRINIHPCGDAGSDSELIGKMITGDIDMTVSSAGNYATYATRLGVTALPFLFEDFESAWAFVDSDTMEDIGKDLEVYNMHILSWFDNGFRCVTTSEKKGPVRNCEDMKSLHIRTPDNHIVIEAMKALGADPEVYPFAELKQALKEDKFEAQENPIPVIYTNHLYEVQKYLSVTNHSYDAMPLTIRSDLWKQIPEEYKKILNEQAAAAQKQDRELVKQQTKDLVAALQNKGMEIVYPELRPFKEATSDVIDKFSVSYGSELLDMIGDYRNEH